MGRVFLLIKNDVLLILKSWNYVNEKKRRGLKIKRILIQFFFTFSIFDISGQSSCGSHWEQEAYIKASNNSAGDQFGKNVSLDGDTLAVGANEEDSGQTTIISGTTAAIDDTKTNSGAVYIYKRDGVSWEQEAYIKSSNSDLDDNFGEVFSLDGDSIAVGVYLEDSNQTTITNGTTAASTDNSNTDSGAVYVFTRTFK